MDIYAAAAAAASKIYLYIFAYMFVCIYRGWRTTTATNKRDTSREERRQCNCFLF